jgi:hypothetical protein
LLDTHLPATECNGDTFWFPFAEASWIAAVRKIVAGGKQGNVAKTSP